ncbi:MAG: GGDEF domain-containing protein [Butyrivibrio sp.]|nr:GGDEF domain-containing protein [Butyrivibrio sp.]
MIKDKKLVALCTYRIYDPGEFAFISELNRLLREEDCAFFIYALNSEIGNSGNEIAETAVFDVIPYDKTDAIVIMDEKIKSRKVVQGVIDKARKAGVPVMVIDGDYDDVSTVWFDYGKGFERVVAHIIEDHKCRRPHMMAGKRNNPFSDERIQIFKDVIKRNGIEFKEDMISYGDFWTSPTRAAAVQLLERDELPDCVICANDIMALNVTDIFMSAGVKVPEDVLVSGFDGIEEAFMSKPGITTAKCDGIALGKKVMEVLLRMFAGENNVKDYIVPDFISNESCGCPRNTSVTFDSISALNNNFYHHQDDIHMLQELTYKVMNDNDVPGQMRFLKKGLAQNVCVVVEESCFDLEKNYFFDDVKTGTKMVVYDFYKDDEAPYPYDPKEVIPHLDVLLKKGFPIIFNGLEYMNKCPGFVCFSFPGINLINYTQTSGITNTFGMAVGGYVTNKYQKYLRDKLQEMYQTDALTGLLNRTAFLDKMVKIRETEANEGRKVNIIASDLNSLKYINDNLGHLEGDKAITAVAHALKKACPEDALCVRIGGDEMFAFFFGVYDLDKIMADIDERLKKATKELGYTVSASMGTYTAFFDKDLDLSKALDVADEHMYENKRRYKERTSNA